MDQVRGDKYSRGKWEARPETVKSKMRQLNVKINKRINSFLLETAIAAQWMLQIKHGDASVGKFLATFPLLFIIQLENVNVESMSSARLYSGNNQGLCVIS